MTRYVWRRLRHLVIYRILHADDTPHRIATGAAIGLFVAFLPLIGLHLVLCLLLAVVLKANRAVSLLVVWVCNPATFLPILTVNVVVGRMVVPGTSLREALEVRGLLGQLPGAAEGAGLIGRVFSAEFWVGLIQLLFQLGAELWIGSVLVGGVAAASGYLVTRRAVVWRRTVRGRRWERKARQVQREYGRSTPADERGYGLQPDGEVGLEKGAGAPAPELAEAATSL